MTTAVWFVVALIISQSYTASLTSMLTVPRLEARVSDIGDLMRASNAVIGYSRNSFVRNYLLDVLHINEKRIKKFSTIEDTAEALKTGEIAATFLELSTAKLLVAKYCKSFRIAGPMYKIGGYGYAFPKGSPLVSDIDEALMKVFEGGVLKELEDTLTASEKCVDNETDNSEISIGPSSFYVLFAWSVGTSTAALVLYAIYTKCRMDRVVSKALKHWRKKKRIFSRKVSYAENPGNFETPGSHFAIAA